MSIPVNKESDVAGAGLSSIHSAVLPLKDCSRTLIKYLFKSYTVLLSNQESMWRDNLWIMDNSLLIGPCKGQEENKRGW